MDTSTFLILTHWSPGLFFPRSDRGFRTLGGPWSSIISTHLRPIIILSLFFRQKTACPRDIFDDDAADATYETETTDNIDDDLQGGGGVPRGNCSRSRFNPNCIVNCWRFISNQITWMTNKIMTPSHSYHKHLAVWSIFLKIFFQDIPFKYISSSSRH